MNYQRTTMVPNIFFASLPDLTEKELKVLLVIIKQTIGWVDKKTGKRKVRDWISTQLFVKKTGLSPKSVSSAISILIAKGHISAETFSGRILTTPQSRSSSKRIYYRCLLYAEDNSKVKSSTDHRKILRTTKLTLTKLNATEAKKNHSTKRLSDWERYCQITGHRKV